MSMLLAPEPASDCQMYLADVNGDGAVDGHDMESFIAAAAP